MRLGGAFLLGIGGDDRCARLRLAPPRRSPASDSSWPPQLARIWAGLVREACPSSTSADPSPATEGERVRLQDRGPAASRACPSARSSRTAASAGSGAYECRLRGHGRTRCRRARPRTSSRGRFPLSDARLVLGDHLGLESVSPPSIRRGGGRRASAARRARDALQRRRAPRRRRATPAPAPAARVRLPLGARVRAGESLRRVHWPRTARTRPAHGEGARGLAARHGRRAARLRSLRARAGEPPNCELRRRRPGRRLGPQVLRRPRAQARRS